MVSVRDGSRAHQVFASHCGSSAGWLRNARPAGANAREKSSAARRW